MNVTIAQFGLESLRDFKACARRVRLLAGLAELSSSQRASWVAAFNRIGERLAPISHRVAVEFQVGERSGSSIVAVQLGGLSEALTLTFPELDVFQVQPAEPGQVNVTIGQFFPPGAMPPRNDELAEWTHILQARSTEAALLETHKRRRTTIAEQAAAAADDLQRHLDLDVTSLETLNMLALVANKTDNLVMVLDTSGTAEWINDAGLRLTGYAFDEIVGEIPTHILFPDYSAGDGSRSLDEAIAVGQGVSEELPMLRADGESVWVSLTLTPVADETGQMVRWIGIATDVSKRRRAQEVLEQAKETAESASRAKSQFLANMSHEIRTPMNAIIGMTELVLGTDLSPEQQSYLVTVKQSADSLLELLNDILDLSKIEAGRLELDSVEFDLADLCAATLNALAHRAEAKGLELAWRLPPTLPTCLVGDSLRLRQILVNLVSNAIKFTEVGQVVVEIECEEQNESTVSIHFAVSDTGVGIPDQRLDDIFAAFEQADPSTTRRFGGTGLGLTICEQLVKMMGGRIWVQSQADVGSTFHFCLSFPYIRREIVESPQLADVGVLVVDDNESTRCILEEQLIGWRMRPSLAADLERASTLLEAAACSGRPFDLVLIDSQIPKGDPFQLANQILDSTELNAQPLMILSASDQHQGARRCRSLGIETYLTKPVSPSNLHDALMNAVVGSGRTDLLPQSPKPALVQPVGLRILVVDDHRANRDLAGAILRKEGHHILFAADGREALDKIAQEDLDVVLMDVQMPEMDGFQTTAAVRTKEAETLSHLPIIAVTAHAMKGDREKCLAAGMDAYLAKPINARELATLVKTVAGANNSNLDVNHSMVETPGQKLAMDFRRALERMGEDMELLKRQMSFFLVDGPALMEELTTAVSHGHHPSIHLVAHRLKGLLANLDDDDSAELARELEFMGRDELDLTEASTITSRLAAGVENLATAIRQFCATSH